MQDDEPLEEWDRRRDARQAASKGRQHAVPLGNGLHRGAHVDPDAPRAIEEWTGTEWAVVGVVEDLAAAKALLYPPPPVQEAEPADVDRVGRPSRVDRTAWKMKSTVASSARRRPVRGDDHR
ncbi:DUF6087 family protein [Streptomyces sp. wa22]|uniref:DUF6087 family protein n=1 Tax=Streptomyces sp. wa22 TaxID=1828244 RepID=UPI00165004A5|nr:DUF6087 family protein [Streptomyces sp. wa22]